MTVDIIKLNQAAAQIHGIRQQTLAIQQLVRTVLAGSACDPVRVELETIDNLLGNVFDDVDVVADLLSGGNGEIAPKANG